MDKKKKTNENNGINNDVKIVYEPILCQPIFDNHVPENILLGLWEKFEFLT